MTGNSLPYSRLEVREVVQHGHESSFLERCNPDFKLNHEADVILFLNKDIGEARVIHLWRGLQLKRMLLLSRSDRVRCQGYREEVILTTSELVDPRVERSLKGNELTPAGVHGHDVFVGETRC